MKKRKEGEGGVHDAKNATGSQALPLLVDGRAGRRAPRLKHVRALVGVGADEVDGRLGGHGVPLAEQGDERGFAAAGGRAGGGGALALGAVGGGVVAGAGVEGFGLPGERGAALQQRGAVGAVGVVEDELAAADDGAVIA